MDINEQFPDVMLDLETTGLDPDHNHIVQIAAVRFNLKERTVHHEFFDRCLFPAPGRYWDESTRDWWLKDKRSVLEGIMKRMESPKMVLTDLCRWAGRDPVFWSKPTHFDHSFLSTYFRQYELGNPFHFRAATDMNSFIRGRYFPRTPPLWETILPFDGDAHNALMDCLHQIKTLFKAAEGEDYVGS